MTVPQQTPAIEYLENGATLNFPVPFYYRDPADLRAFRTLEDGTVLELNNGAAFTASPGATDAGGTLTLTASVNGATLSIRRATPRKQDTDYETTGPFTTESHEKALDLAMLVSQEQDAEIARAPKFPRGSSPVDFADLGSLEDGDILEFRGGQFAKFNTTPFAGKFFAGAAGTGRLTPASAIGGVDGDLRNDLAEPTGAENIGFEGSNAAVWFNIVKASRRPAMDGIFSSGADQRATLLAFITDAAASGKTIEWGPIDLTFDVTTLDAESRRGLGVPSGSRWVLHPNTRFRALPNDASNYDILSIRSSQDIVIEGCGAKLIGDRDAHTGVTGEHGHGVGIRGSSNIRINDLVVEDCWGDGFYIGVSPDQNWSEDIYFQNTKAIRARRNGISLVSAKRFWSLDHVSEDTNGTAPEYGVDIEPNFPTEFLEDINFVRTLTRNSASRGFGIFLDKLDGSANPVSIRLIDCVDDGSATGPHIENARNLGGRIDLIRPVSRNAQTMGVSLRRKAVSGPHVTVDHPIVENWNRSGTTDTLSQAAIAVFGTSGGSGTEALGGVDILHPEVSYDSGTVNAAVHVQDQRAGADPMAGVRIIDPIDLAGLKCFITGTDTILVDGARVSEATLPDANVTLDNSSVFYHNPIAATAVRLYTLAANLPIGTERVFETRTAVASRIVWPSGDQTYPEALGGSRYYTAAANIGNRLKIRKFDTGKWQIIERVGTWTVS